MTVPLITTPTALAWVVEALIALVIGLVTAQALRPWARRSAQEVIDRDKAHDAATVAAPLSALASTDIDPEKLYLLEHGHHSPRYHRDTVRHGSWLIAAAVGLVTAAGLAPLIAHGPLVRNAVDESSLTTTLASNGYRVVRPTLTDDSDALVVVKDRTVSHVSTNASQASEGRVPVTLTNVGTVLATVDPSASPSFQASSARAQDPRLVLDVRTSQGFLGGSETYSLQGAQLCEQGERCTDLVIAPTTDDATAYIYKENRS